MLAIEDLLQLNQYAQGVETLASAKLWFDSKPPPEKVRTIRQLAVLFQEARAVPEDLAAAIQWAGLKPSDTPVVLMERGRLGVQAAKVSGLPEYERMKAFLLFLGLLSVADARRRETVCSSACNHWWHRDLSDEDVVRRILEVDH